MYELSYDLYESFEYENVPDIVIIMKYSSTGRYVKSPKKLDLLNKTCYVLFEKSIIRRQNVQEFKLNETSCPRSEWYEM